jgi:hypothetical protein
MYVRNRRIGAEGYPGKSNHHQSWTISFEIRPACRERGPLIPLSSAPNRAQFEPEKTWERMDVWEATAGSLPTRIISSSTIPCGTPPLSTPSPGASATGGSGTGTVAAVP